MMTKDETTADQTDIIKPGVQLANYRMERGLTLEYIAGKLNLRIHLVEQLENDDYHMLPQPVFIKGYIRAYAQLLDIPSDSLIETFNQVYKYDSKPSEKLWQTRRETNKAEYAIRWITIFFALIVTFAVVIWWYNNKENQAIFKSALTKTEISDKKSEHEIRLTDLSKMRSLLSSQNQIETFTPVEKKSE